MSDTQNDNKEDLIALMRVTRIINNSSFKGEGAKAVITTLGILDSLKDAICKQLDLEEENGKTKE